MTQWEAELNSLLCGFTECVSLFIPRRASATKGNMEGKGNVETRTKSDEFESKIYVTLLKQTVCDWGNGPVVSHHVLGPSQTLDPAGLFIDTGSAAQSLNPDSVQKGIRGDWNTQRPCSDTHLNKLVYENTPAEDTVTNVEEWDMNCSMADRELSKNTLDNHSTTANSLSHGNKLGKLRAVTVSGR